MPLVRASCERAAERVLRLGPLGLAALMLVLILLLPVPSAEARSAGIPTTGYATDNLIRWGLGRDMAIAAEVDLFDRCNPGATGVLNCANLGTPTQAIWCVPTKCGFPASATVDRELWVHDTQANAITCLIWKPTTAGSCTNLATHNATEQSDFGGNRTLLNVTWDRDVPLTNIFFRVSQSTAGNTGTITFNAYLRNAADAIFGNVSLGSMSCAVTDATLTAAFARVTARSVSLNADFTGCTIGPDRIALIPHGYRLFSAGNRQDALDFNDKHLEHGDWMTTRDSAADGGGGAASVQNMSAITNTTVSFPVGTSYFYATGSVEKSVPWAATWFVSPAGWTAYSGLTGCAFYTWLGPSSNTIGGSQAQKLLSVFRVQVNGTVACTQRLTGFTANNQDLYYLDNNEQYFGNTKTAGGGDWSLASRPILGSAFFIRTAGAPSSTHNDVAAVYPETSGALALVPCCSPVFGSNSLDATAYTAVAVSPNFDSSQPTPFNVTLSYTVDERIFGHAVWFNYVTYNATTHLGCTSPRMTIDGAPVNNASIVAVNGIDHIGDGRSTACFLLIDDFARLNAWPTSDPQGMGALIGQTRVHQVSVTEWGNRAPPNGPAGNGYVMRHIQFFDGNKTERLACNSTPRICYGNVDTTGIPINGLVSAVRVNLLACDGGTANLTTLSVSQATCNTGNSTQTLLNVSFVDADSGLIARSNATGRANFTTTTPSLHLSATIPGYKGAHFNVSLLQYPTYNLTFYLTRNASLRQDTDCLTGPANGYNATTQTFSCTITFNSSPFNPCAEVDPGTGACLTLGASDVQWALICPFDGSGVARVVPNVAWVEHRSGRAGSMNSPDGSCDAEDAAFGFVFIGALFGTSDAGDLEVSAAGFRGIRYLVDPAANGTEGAIVGWVMKTGDGQATNIQANSTTRLIIDNLGQPRRFLLVALTDGDPPITPIESPLEPGRRPLPSIPEAIATLGSQLGFTGESGDFMWGVFLLFMLTLCFWGAYWWFARGDADGAVMGLLVTPGFGVVAILGLWPSWFLALIAFVVLMVGFIVFRRHLPGGE